MSVHQIAVLLTEGLDAEAIRHEYPHLDRLRIQAGITFYLANQERIDREIEDEEREYREAAAQQPLLRQSGH